MTSAIPESLDPGLWRQAFARLLSSVDKNDQESISPKIRLAYHLIKLAPPPLRSIFGELLSEEIFDALIEESQPLAAMSLLGMTLNGKSDGSGLNIRVNTQMAMECSPYAAEPVNLASARSIIVSLCKLIEQLGDDRTV